MFEFFNPTAIVIIFLRGLISVSLCLIISKLFASVKEADKFFLHIFIDVAKAGEGFASFFVAAERTDKVGVFHFLVKVADEGTPG